jgi:hypothetical protein
MEWLLVLPSAILAFLFGNIVHEGSHGLVRKWCGLDVSLYLYPHNKADLEFSLAFWKEGFRWGAVSSKLPEGVDFPARARGFSAGAPMASSTLLFLVGVAIWKTIGPTEIWALNLLLAALIVGQGFDATRGLLLSFLPDREKVWFLRMGGRHLDVNKAIEHLEIPRGLVNVVGVAVGVLWLGLSVSVLVPSLI